MADLSGSILAVSDDPGIAADLRFGLPEGLETVEVADGRAAWKELVESAAPRAVVVELRTGSAGGFALARDLASSDALRAVPVVMVIERDQDHWLAKQAGAHVILRKPLEPGLLVDAVVATVTELPEIKHS